MGTKIFSSGETQDKSWIPDFYDDAILDSDQYVKNLFDYLENSGKIDNTLVILYSDHGMRGMRRKRCR
jgi:arylsulfatase A-like enzyme